MFRITASVPVAPQKGPERSSFDEQKDSMNGGRFVLDVGSLKDAHYANALISFRAAIHNNWKKKCLFNSNTFF